MILIMIGLKLSIVVHHLWGISILMFVMNLGFLDPTSDVASTTGPLLLGPFHEVDLLLWDPFMTERLSLIPLPTRAGLLLGMDILHSTAATATLVALLLLLWAMAVDCPPSPVGDLPLAGLQVNMTKPTSTDHPLQMLDHGANSEHYFAM